MAGTHGHVNLAAAPECDYAPNMTRAEAIARRAAGTLNPNCVVIVPGPTIGTAGNTSATEIELNPVAPDDLGLTARVNTTFDNSAWAGTYDIDLGAAGSITRLTDNFGNTVSDVDADSPTVHTQWPWHLGSATFRDNTVNDSTLPGWDALTAVTGLITDTTIVESTINLTGNTGVITFQRSLLTGADITKPGASPLLIQRSQVQDGVWVLAGGTSNLQFFGAEMISCTVTRDLAATSGLSVISGRLMGSILTQNAGASGVGAAVGLTLSFCTSHGGTFTQNGPGRVAVSNCFLNNTPIIRNTVTATRGLQVTGCQIISGTIEQARTTAAALPDNVQRSFLNTASIFLTGAAGMAAATTHLSDSTVQRSTVTTVDPTVTPTVNGSEITGSAAVTVNTGGSLDDCRVASGATLATGFPCDNSILEGGNPAFNKVTTGPNLGRLGNAAFDSWI